MQRGTHFPRISVHPEVVPGHLIRITTHFCFVRSCSYDLLVLKATSWRMILRVYRFIYISYRHRVYHDIHRLLLILTATSSFPLTHHVRLSLGDKEVLNTNSSTQSSFPKKETSKFSGRFQFRPRSKSNQVKRTSRAHQAFRTIHRHLLFVHLSHQPSQRVRNRNLHDKAVQVTTMEGVIRRN